MFTTGTKYFAFKTKNHQRTLNITVFPLKAKDEKDEMPIDCFHLINFINYIIFFISDPLKGKCGRVFCCFIWELGLPLY